MADTPSGPPSGSSTPTNARFTSQGHTTEDALKEQTYGLVHLSDFRKRRAEARELSGGITPATSGAATPDGREPVDKPAFKKRKKGVKKGGLSFGDEEEEDQEIPKTTATATSAATTTDPTQDGDEPADSTTVLKKRLKPNGSLAFAPKAVTKSALQRENVLKEALRKEYVINQEAVKQTEFLLPFTFFDGKSSPGGVCRMKKGDQIWLFLERARKVGADMYTEKGDRSKKDWARISVDDLMVVRGDIIVPPHQDFHYFILNKTVGYDKNPLFAYSSEPTATTPKELLPTSKAASTPTTPQAETPPADLPTHLSTAATRKAAAALITPDAELEGYQHDPSATKVVDRRWYERNKHIYPASLWEDFDATRDYASGVRKDAEGNALFYSRR
ncbi:hypothetical protein LTR78_002206 [Recurvomyces mirabilis]|uniref:FAM50A/XAP5 C-terminal domain-containing protein n=1 Tax=Recurvomyces mirabilis TaxID=574656 RepID=A0AAE0WUE7_9PEZI|nr:hypothetical protein LTR78_002206 [Recurvomyces mirabilis]KAK5160662.1 hypothetical protein LTS14_001674 [Recurvomyces mirabilis]